MEELTIWLEAEIKDSEKKSWGTGTSSTAIATEARIFALKKVMSKIKEIKGK